MEIPFQINDLAIKFVNDARWIYGLGGIRINNVGQKNMNKSDYPQASRRVLSTINQMFSVYYWNTAIKPLFDQHNHLEPTHIAFENATIESSLITIRAFDDFILSKKNRPDDLVASDFHKLNISGNGISTIERTKINKQIAHLTTIDLSTDRQGYSYRNCLKEVIPGAINFCDYVTKEISTDPSLVQFAQDTKEICVNITDNYVNKEDAQQDAT